jgi:hypothetical protein
VKISSAMYISAPASRRDNDDLHNLSAVPASAFEVVERNPLYQRVPCAPRSGPEHQLQGFIADGFLGREHDAGPDGEWR